MRPATLQAQAFAKINLSLEVIGRRADGYHDVATVMQTIDLADTLTITPSPNLAVECDSPDLSAERNIVWDAAVALARHAGVAPAARIYIEKRIPVAAGLGGGSADAAAALRGLNLLWDLELAEAELVSVAAGLGSDVPFLLNGGTALGEGKGDRIKRLPAAKPMVALLVIPPTTIARKTPTLYGLLQDCDFSDGSRTRELFASVALSQGRVTADLCRNAFTRAALEIFPGLAEIWETTAAVTRCPPRLSGAGPAFFCVQSDEAERGSVEIALRNSGATVRLARTINPAQAV